MAMFPAMLSSGRHMNPSGPRRYCISTNTTSLVIRRVVKGIEVTMSFRIEYPEIIISTKKNLIIGRVVKVYSKFKSKGFEVTMSFRIEYPEITHL